MKNVGVKWENDNVEIWAESQFSIFNLHFHIIISSFNYLILHYLQLHIRHTNQYTAS
jgi:hypothetical protein